MAAVRSARRQVAALMLWSAVALGVSVIGSSAKAEDDASRFTYVRLHCTADEQSHFTDVTIDLVKENFAPPAAPIAVGGNKSTSRAFIAGFGAHCSRLWPSDRNPLGEYVGTPIPRFVGDGNGCTNLVATTISSYGRQIVNLNLCGNYGDKRILDQQLLL